MFGRCSIHTLLISLFGKFDLLYGGRLVVVPHTVSRSPKEFLQLLVKEKVTVLNQTPSAFYQLMQADRENEEIGQNYLYDMLFWRRST